MRQEAIIRTAGAVVERRAYGLPFYLTLIYLALEYGRPQASIPVLELLHLPAVITILLAFALIGSGKLRLDNAQTKLFMALLVLMAAHVPFDVNNYWAFETTREMAITFVAYLAILTFIDSFEKFQAMITAWIAIHVYLAITGIIKGGVGIGGFLGDENDFALALNMIIPFGIFLAMEAKEKSKRILFFVITGIFVVCNVLTLSRGGFVGLVAVGLYCWIKSPRKIQSGLLVVLLILTMTLFASQRYWERIQSIQKESQEGSTGSGQERIYSWTAAWEMFLDYPVFGVGPGNFNWNFETYEPQKGFGGKLHGGRAAHSLYFTLLSELGIAGVIIYFLMLKANWKDRKELIRLGINNKEPIFKKAHYLTLALSGSLVGFLVSGTFISVLYYPSFWILIAFSLALRKVVNKRLTEISGSRVESTAEKLGPLKFQERF